MARVNSPPVSLPSGIERSVSLTFRERRHLTTIQVLDAETGRPVPSDVVRIENASVAGVPVQVTPDGKPRSIPGPGWNPPDNERRLVFPGQTLQVTLRNVAGRHASVVLSAEVEQPLVLSRHVGEA